jgi:hypothetical protein
MDEACDKHGTGEKYIQLWWKNLKEEGHTDGLSVDGYNNIKTNFRR